MTEKRSEHPDKVESSQETPAEKDEAEEQDDSYDDMKDTGVGEGHPPAGNNFKTF